MERAQMNNSPALVRDALPSDAAAVDAIVHAAFANSKLGYQGEAELVRAVVGDDDAILSLVAEAEAVPIGYTLFSRMTVEADGAALRAAALAPVAVIPDHQIGGVGSLLIRTGLARLEHLGVQICFVLGHPAYYPRFGFEADVAVPFASPYAGPHFMALLLDKALQIPKSGRADYAAAFSR
jgi:putative acetyltransferase